MIPIAAGGSVTIIKQEKESARRWPANISGKLNKEQRMSTIRVLVGTRKGAFVYTGYAWFRQLPAGVPGGYRLFANLISLKKQPR